MDKPANGIGYEFDERVFRKRKYIERFERAETADREGIGTGIPAILLDFFP